ncbi:hypothetical protein [Ornithinibacillus halotolerans]|uniref:DUF3221 domain-containing protein n=1 Tax=Ornithinibacillus halotolerans TaxID=1274357 RepID=A0A916SE83_9BACI|nr:hypothetical protein [Ornithinibacillus halotolerans]GGA93209.1 hypothetical protein GCM10008025_39480 [Ornithinibacillus halotolerans]
MKRRIFLLLFLLVLISCSSKVETFTGVLLEVDENLLVVSCTDVIKGSYGDAWAYDCPVNLTNTTIILNENEEEIEINELKKHIEYYTKVEVTLVSKTDIVENINEITAKIIKIID